MQTSQHPSKGPSGGHPNLHYGGIHRVLIGLTLALALVAPVAPVRADNGLTGAVAANWFPRTVDGGLHSIAHARVAEISCPGCMNHSLQRAGTWEVLAWNSGLGDPISGAIAGWKGSPVHNAILSDRSLGRIGCAQATVSGVDYFVCVLAPGGTVSAPAPSAPKPAPAPPSGGSSGGGSVLGGAAAPSVMLPDTSASVALGGAVWADVRGGSGSALLN